MQAWTLTLLIVGTLNGQPQHRPVVIEGLFNQQQCLTEVRRIIARLPRGHRVVRPTCEARGWLT